MNQGQQQKTIPIKIDLSKQRPMKCYCGSNQFLQSFNLFYISPILCGDPQGATATVFMYECKLCGQFYPKGLPKSEVDKIYGSLDPVRKAQVDAIRAKLKAGDPGGAKILADSGGPLGRDGKH